MAGAIKLGVYSTSPQQFSILKEQDELGESVTRTLKRLRDFGFLPQQQEEENQSSSPSSHLSTDFAKVPLILTLRKQINNVISKYGFEDLKEEITKSTLRQLLSDKDNFELFLVSNMEFLDVLVKSTGNEDYEKVSNSLVRTFVVNGKAQNAVKHIITEEIQNHIGSFMTIFREDNMRIKVISNYFKLVGKPYLRRVLSPILISIDKKKIFKLFSSSSSSSPSSPSLSTLHSVTGGGSGAGNTSSSSSSSSSSMMMVNDKSLKFSIKIADKIIQGLNENVTCPAYISLACAHIKDELTAKAPDFIIPSLGNLLFLRWIFPALVSPHDYGIIDSPPSFELKRLLISTAKYLQGIINKISSPEESKEVNAAESLRCSRLLTFLGSITKNASQLQSGSSSFSASFLQQLNKDEIAIFEEVRVERNFAIQNIYQYVKLHLDEIESLWPSPPSPTPTTTTPIPTPTTSTPTPTSLHSPLSPSSLNSSSLPSAPLCSSS